MPSITLIFILEKGKGLKCLLIRGPLGSQFPNQKEVLRPLEIIDLRPIEVTIFIHTSSNKGLRMSIFSEINTIFS